MAVDWQKFFPLKSPRSSQIDVIERIIKEIDAGQHIIILEAGTGVGKSAIAVCIANYIRSLGLGGEEESFDSGAYVLTSQKILQEQYIRDFPYISDLRSSSNFACSEGPGENCGQTSRYKMYTRRDDQKGSNTCPGCPYRAAKDRFMKANIGVTNYSYFMSETVYAGQLRPRDLLVLDEAHNVENEMRKWATLSISESLADDIGQGFPFRDSNENTVKWLLQQYRPALSSYTIGLGEKLEEMERRNVKRGLTKMIDELDFLDRHMCSLNRILGDGAKTDEQLLLNWDEDRDGRRSLIVQPLEAGAIAQDLLYPMGRYVLLMSATILDEKVFKRSAGIKKSAFVSQPTPFPAENFGIVYRPVGSMAKAKIQQTTPKMIDAVRRILRDHPKDKGIIHCSNYEVARAVGTIRDRRLLVQESAKDREEIIRKHISSREPTVIVSPSMMEGLDLEGDLGRFQVLCKVPFPNMGDPIVSAKMKLDEGWYAWCTARTLIQAVGRCVRSMDDTAATYILDESFGPFMEKWLSMFPQYFWEMSMDI